MAPKAAPNDVGTYTEEEVETAQRILTDLVRVYDEDPEVHALQDAELLVSVNEESLTEVR